MRVKKNVRIIFTGGTIAGNVARREHALNQKAAPESFLNILDHAAAIVSKTWDIGIERSASKLFNKDSSNINPGD
jgi:L-asparaginase/Glu-tRNA(Gln) amidotransferase subunit D